MWYKDLFAELEKLKDDEIAYSMSKYMKNNFIFLGIKKSNLDEFFKPYLKDSKNYEFNYDFINECYKKDYREAQYLGLSYLLKNINKVQAEDFDKIKNLIITKSWWDTVDLLDSVVGYLVLKDSNLKKEMINWSIADNIWLRRVSIDFQQKYKDKTDESILEQIIVNNLESKEFFINKAIGWSLRNYSKVNPDWVISFINKYNTRMDKLSIREAKKNI